MPKMRGTQKRRLKQIKVKQQRDEIQPRKAQISSVQTDTLITHLLPSQSVFTIKSGEFTMDPRLWVNKSHKFDKLDCNFAPGDVVSLICSPTDKVSHINAIDRIPRRAYVTGIYVKRRNNNPAEQHDIVILKDLKPALISPALFELDPDIKWDFSSGQLFRMEVAYTPKAFSFHHIQKINDAVSLCDMEDVLNPGLATSTADLRTKNWRINNLLTLLQNFAHKTQKQTDTMTPEFKILTPSGSLPTTLQLTGALDQLNISENCRVRIKTDGFQTSGILCPDTETNGKSPFQERSLLFSLSSKKSVQFWDAVYTHRLFPNSTIHISNEEQHISPQLMNIWLSTALTEWMPNQRSRKGYIMRLLFGLVKWTGGNEIYPLDPIQYLITGMPPLVSQECGYYFYHTLVQCAPFSLLMGPPGAGKTNAVNLLLANLLQRFSDPKILVVAQNLTSINQLSSSFQSWVDNHSMPYSQVRVALQHTPVEKLGDCIPNVPEYFCQYPMPNEPNDISQLRREVDAIEEHISTFQVPKTRSPEREKVLSNMYATIDRCKEQKKALELSAVDCVRKPKVFFTTTMATTHDIFDGKEFDLILIDGAETCSIPQFLFTLRKLKSYGRVYMFGDPEQLQPSVRQLGMAPDLLKTSPAELVTWHRKIPIIRLVETYRGPQELIAYNAQAYYRGRWESQIPLTDCSLLFQSLSMPNPSFPIVWINISGCEQHVHQSYCNPEESVAIQHLVQHLLRQGVFLAQIGILTFYESQALLIRQAMSSLYPSTHKQLLVSTVNDDEVHERDIILLSTVRSSLSNTIDEPPLHDQMDGIGNRHWHNVATSRSKQGLVILGNVFQVGEYKVWAPYIRYLQEHNAIIPQLDQLLKK